MLIAGLSLLVACDAGSYPERVTPEGMFVGPATPVMFAPGQANAAVASVLNEDESVVESYLTYFEGLGTEGVIIGAASPIDVRAFAVLATGEVMDLADLVSRESNAHYDRLV